MAAEKIEVKLPTELLAFARSMIDGQDFVCVDDVVIEALCRFRPMIAEELRQREWLKAETQKGIDDLDSGDVFSEDEVFDEVDEILGRQPESAR